MSTEISSVFSSETLSSEKDLKMVLHHLNPPLARDEMSPEYFETKMNRSLEEAETGKVSEVREAFARIRAEI